MPAVAKRRLFTEEEYLLIERQASERSEFHRGEIFAMAGATHLHETIAGNLFGLLWQELRKRGCSVYKSDMKVRCPSTGRYTYPDVVVVCGELEFLDQRKDVLLNPTLLIEVTSDSTVNYDRGDKSVDYRSIESLRDLLIVAHDQPSIDHFVRQDKNTWNLTSVQGLEATMELPSIGCRLALAEIFAGVEFAPGARPALRVAKEMDE